MPVDPSEAKMIAAQLISDAWQQAIDQGIASELVASTALSAALSSLVQTQGRDATVKIADRLLKAVREGRFDHHKPN